MNKKLEDYIIETLEAYENDKLTDFEDIEKDQILCKVIDSEIKLLQLLDDNQAETFRKFSLALIAYKDTIKAEYFSAGFLHGLYTEKAEFEL